MKNQSKKIKKSFFLAGLFAFFWALALVAQQDGTFSSVKTTVSEVFAQASAAVSRSSLLKKLSVNSLVGNNSPGISISGENFSRPNYVEGELLVKYREKLEPEILSHKSQVNQVRQIGQLSYGQDYKKYEIKDGSTVEEKVKEFSYDPDVLYAQPNFIYYPTATVPNDPEYARLWGLKNTGQTVADPSYGTNNPGTSGSDMDMELAWDITTDCSGATVAVIDTGINYNHEDFAGNLWDGGSSYPNHGYDYTDTNDNDPIEGGGHGTHVAGTIGARGNNGTGMTGVCWTASIMALKVFPIVGGASTTDIIEAINFAANNDAKVINMSLGGTSTQEDAAYRQAIELAESNDVLVVVAAGNSNADHENLTLNGIKAQDYPCDFTSDSILCVAALDQAYNRASFSDYGAVTVDVGAPGTNVFSTWPVRTVTENSFPGDYWSYFPSTDSFGLYPLTSGNNLLQIPDNPGEFNSVNWNGYTLTYDDTSPDVELITYLRTDSTVDYVTSEFYIKTDFGNSTEDQAWYCYGSGNPMVTTFCGNFDENISSATKIELDLSSVCLDATCDQAFNMDHSTDGETGHGVEFIAPKLSQHFLETNQYNTIDGTSMASPHVAGLAAMLRSFNPDYTYLDTAKVIKESGEDNAALSGITTTGKSVNAFNSLTHVLKPEFVGSPTVTD